MQDLKHYQHTLLFWLLIVLTFCLGMRGVFFETKNFSQSSRLKILVP